jgi:hypothetical protein
MKHIWIISLALLASSLVAGTGQICRHPHICERASNGSKELVKCSTASDVTVGFDNIGECEIATQKLNLSYDDCYCMVWYIP